MFSWLRNLVLGKRQVRGIDRGVPKGTDRQTLINSLDDLIKTPGKACYRTLVELSSSCTKDEFIYFVHCPAFVGSGIRDGYLQRAEGAMSGKRELTHAFSASEIARLVEGASLEQSIFLLRKPLQGQSSEYGRFTIGRTRENDILMMDFAISRSHGVVELNGEEYVLKDLGSSNGTFVNSEQIDGGGRLLKDGDSVRFARYEFLFLGPGSLFDLLRDRVRESPPSGKGM